jgi:cytochrome c biogenesis protein CcmG/thiol:disulfide interchange protein DsbE
MLDFADRRHRRSVRSRQSVDATQPQRLTPPQLLAALAGVAALVALIVVIGLVLRGGPERSGPGIISIGRATDIRPRPAPDFVLTSFDGQRLQLSDYRGRIVVLNFWATWCPPCRVEAPVLQRAAERLDPLGVTLLGINVWDGQEAATGFLTESGVTYPNAEDATRLIPVEFGVTGLPETFVIDRRGVLVRRWVGPLTDAQLDDLLAPVLAASPT